VVHIALGQGVAYRGITHCAVDTFKKEGFFALYKGVGVTLVTGVPYVTLQLTFYDVFKRLLPQDNTIVYSLLSGAGAGLVAETLTYPGSTLQHRMMTNGIGGRERLYRNTWDCLVTSIRTRGVRDLFSGLSAGVIRCLPATAIQMVCYDTFKRYLT